MPETRITEYPKICLIIKGDVQGVAYRAHVKRIARSLKIKGTARNLEEGDVVVFCQGDPKILVNFKKLIEVKREGQSDLYSPNVEEIKTCREGTKKYFEHNPPKEFKAFNIDYGVQLNSFEEESLTKTEIGSLVLIESCKKTDVVGKKVEEMDRNVVQTFDRLDKKYDSFGKKINEVHGDLKSMESHFKSMSDNIKNMNDNFNFLVNYLTNNKNSDKKTKEKS